MKFGLDNIARLCAALDHPERTFTSIIIAGTNGKGSVTAMVHRALVAAGHRSARYTSPHLERLEERFVIDDGEVETETLRAAAGRVRKAIDALRRDGALASPPTFFECATAMAFDLFRAAGVRVAVLEVGLGGRLDSTNVVTPIAAAITSIGLDHQAQLGSSLASIAFEKAGVIKPGIPVICGPLPAEAAGVIQAVCLDRRARMIRAAACVDVDRLTAGSPLALAGLHQRHNAEVAACLLTELDRLGIPIGHEAIRAGLTDVVWPGRLERFQYRDAEVLLDAAHNPDGARALRAYLESTGWQGAALVFGAMQDKDVSAMLGELAPVFDSIVCTTADTPRAMGAGALAAAAARVAGARWTVSTLPDPHTALSAATERFPRVVVAGSIFLIGPLRGILRPR